MAAPSRRRAAPGAVAGVATSTREPTGTDGPEHLCTCCDPRNPLVLRPDLGTLGDGTAEFALCVLHDPEPVVYRNRGDGVYAQAPELSLSAAGEIVDQEGRVVARVAGDGFQRLTTVDDEEPPPGGEGGAEAGPAEDRASQPRTVHVDLSQDDFYAAGTLPVT
jgi:hypothetical protein